MSWDVFGKRVKRILKRLTDCRGHTDTETFVMEIERSLSTQARLQTELHEIGHLLLDRLSIIDTHSVSSELEEIISNGYATWIIENRKYLVKRLLELDRPTTRTRKKKSAPTA